MSLSLLAMNRSTRASVCQIQKLNAKPLDSEQLRYRDTETGKGVKRWGQNSIGIGTAE